MPIINAALRPVLGVALALAFSFGAARAANPPETRDAAGVLQAEARWMLALKARDAAALDRLLADDFVDTSWQGRRRTKAQMLNALRQGGNGPQTLSDLAARLYGDAAVVTGLNSVQDAKGAVVAQIRFTDVFVYRAGRWVAAAAQETVETPAPPASAASTPPPSSSS
jgi:ketosteroid isomerase-like protein